MNEIIPKAVLTWKGKDYATWDCPGCGIKNAECVTRDEARKLTEVQCGDCCRKFEIRRQ